MEYNPKAIPTGPPNFNNFLHRNDWPDRLEKKSGFLLQPRWTFRNFLETFEIAIATPSNRYFVEKKTVLEKKKKNRNKSHERGWGGERDIIWILIDRKLSRSQLTRGTYKRSSPSRHTLTLMHRRTNTHSPDTRTNVYTKGIRKVRKKERNRQTDRQTNNFRTFSHTIRKRTIRTNSGRGVRDTI